MSDLRASDKIANLYNTGPRFITYCSSWKSCLPSKWITNIWTCSIKQHRILNIEIIETVKTNNSLLGFQWIACIMRKIAYCRIWLKVSHISRSRALVLSVSNWPGSWYAQSIKLGLFKLTGNREIGKWGWFIAFKSQNKTNVAKCMEGNRISFVMDLHEKVLEILFSFPTTSNISEDLISW